MAFTGRLFGCGLADAEYAMNLFRVLKVLMNSQQCGKSTAFQPFQINSSNFYSTCLSGRLPKSNPVLTHGVLESN
jgi:hypothetical protein